MSADKALLGTVTQRVTTFHLPENFNSECDFTITDDLGEPWLKVVRKPWSLRRKTFLFNGRSGEPVALIERKLRSLFRSQGDYRILAATPNQPDQASTGSLQGASLYRFAELKASANPSYSSAYSCCEGSAAGPEVWLVNAGGESQALEVVPANDESLCVVRVDGAASMNGELTYGITCAPGVDPVQAICVALIQSIACPPPRPDRAADAPPGTPKKSGAKASPPGSPEKKAARAMASAATDDAKKAAASA
jgi:hypothetical protein